MSAFVAVLLLANHDRAHAAPPSTTPTELATDQYSALRVAPSEILPSRGSDDSLVLVEVYYAPGHASAGAAAEQVRRYLERAELRGEPSPAREVLRLMPLRMHPELDLVSESLVEAARQNRLWPYFDRLTQERNPPQAETELVRIARDAGLDIAELTAAWSTHRHEAAVLAMQERALEEGRSPSELLANGRRVSSWVNIDGFDLAIKAAQKRSERALQSGVPRAQVVTTLRATELAMLGVDRNRMRQRSPLQLDAAMTRGYGFAPVTIAFFGSLTSAVGPDWASWLQRIELRYPGAIRIAYFPIASLRGGSDERMVALCYAASAVDKFWPLYDAAFARAGTRRTGGEIEAIAQSLGVDPTETYNALSLGAFSSRIELARAELRRIGGSSPALAINGVLYTSSLNFERFAATVGRELERGVIERAPVVK